MLASLSFSVGTGEAIFKMHRGSFKIKEYFKEKHNLTAGALVQTDAGYCCGLKNKSGDEILELRLVPNNTRVDFSFKALTDQPFNRLWLRLPSDAKEHIYGCGENFTKFDLKGEKVRIWVQEHQSVGKIAKKIILEKVFGKNPKRMNPYQRQQSYYVQPTFLSSKKYFVHFDTGSYMVFDFSHAGYHEIICHEIAGFTIGTADTFEGLMASLSEKLGRQPLLPDWVYDGAILGIQGGMQPVEDKLALVKKYDMAVAGVWCQDWQGARITAVGKQLMWNWKWDSGWYQDLDVKIREMKRQGVRFLGYINPFLAVEKELYQYASAQGYCVKDQTGSDYLVKSTTFASAMVDFTNPDAYEWIKGIIKQNMINFGLAGWMADFGEYLPTDCVLFSGENPKSIHNRWPAIWAKINREALEESGRLGEILFFTRAGHTETVAHSTMMWNGDQYVDWSLDGGMPSVIPAMLSLACCGFGLSHSDTGGFSTFFHVKRSPELMMRWAEMNAFSPLFRSHEGVRPDDNAQFDANEEVLRHYAKMSRIHAMLKPYLKDAVALNHVRGMPVVRPMFFHYDEPRAYTEQYQYLLGRDILAAPTIEEAAARRTLWLPRDRWIHLWSGSLYSGGETEVETPLGHPAVFIREKSEQLQLLLALKDA